MRVTTDTGLRSQYAEMASTSYVSGSWWSLSLSVSMSSILTLLLAKSSSLRFEPRNPAISTRSCSSSSILERIARIWLDMAATEVPEAAEELEEAAPAARAVTDREGVRLLRGRGAGAPRRGREGPWSAMWVGACSAMAGGGVVTAVRVS